MSCPKLRFANSSLLTFECVIGDLASTRTAFTKTASNFSVLVESCFFSCPKTEKRLNKKINNVIFCRLFCDRILNKFFITIKIIIE